MVSKKIDIGILKEHSGSTGGIVHHTIQTSKSFDGLFNYPGGFVRRIQAAINTNGIGTELVDYLVYRFFPAAVNRHFGTLLDA